MENKYLDRAKALREDPNVHYNCAQAVTATFAEECSLTREQAIKLGAHFGSGMKMAATCGAITGALMVIGLLGGGDEATAQPVALRQQWAREALERRPLRLIF